MNFKQEIAYRLLLMVINHLKGEGKISDDKRSKAIEKLVKQLNPPFGEMEYDAYGKENI